MFDLKTGYYISLTCAIVCGILALISGSLYITIFAFYNTLNTIFLDWMITKQGSNQ